MNIKKTTAIRWAAVPMVAVSTLYPSANIAAPTALDPMANLAGRWVGTAVMQTMSGSPANFKCVVTYLPRADGSGLKQNLRCDNGADFKLHASTLLQVEGTKVTGRWEDKINSIEGTVSGSVTKSGFEVQLSGQFFQAKMAVSGSSCDQSVKVMPAQSEMFKELAAELKRC